MKCDFCSSTEVKYLHEARDIEVCTLIADETAHKMSSSGGWMVCQTCHDYILAGQYEALLKRSYLEFGKIFPMEIIQGNHQEVWMFLQISLNAFLKARTGKWRAATEIERQKEGAA